MVRILFDELGDGHNDMFLKIDATPSLLQVADSYFLGGFLDGPQENEEEVIIEYLKYVQNQFSQLTEKETFIVFDLSDEYVGGIFISKGKKGLIRIEYSWTKELAGWELSHVTVDKKVQEIRNQFQTDRDWLISTENIEKGLNWSLNKIKTTYNTSYI